MFNLAIVSLFSRVGLMGQFPTAKEVEKYKILADFPALLPMDPIHNDPEWFSEQIIESVRANRYKY